LTSDIEGCSPRRLINNSARMKDVLNVSDIPGAQSSPNTRTRKASYSAFDYSDVSAPNWKSTRHGNPLNPTYRVFDDEGKTYEIGEVEGAKPRTIA
jgi:hypothetical protein